MTPEPVSPWQWTQEGPQRDFAKAFAGFREALDSAWVTPERGERVAAAFEHCASVVQEPLAIGDTAQRAAAARAAYLAALHEAVGTGAAREAVGAALRRYATELASAFAGSRGEALTAGDLIAIANSMTWVANLAADVENSGS
jgi:hypothetical protein